jgi:hypothetical protein
MSLRKQQPSATTTSNETHGQIGSFIGEERNCIVRCSATCTDTDGTCTDTGTTFTDTSATCADTDGTCANTDGTCANTGGTLYGHRRHLSAAPVDQVSLLFT